MFGKTQTRLRSSFAASHVVCWLFAGSGCLVDNPAYQPSTINDVGAPDDAAETLDATVATMPLPPQVPTAGLVGWWSFDQIQAGIVRDLSGNSLNGNVVGNLTLVTGTQGRAASFDGNTYVKVPYKPVLDEVSGAVTVAAWVRSKPTVSGNPRLLLSRQQGQGQWKHYGLACDDNAVFMYLAPGLFDHVHETLLLSEWVHAAATFDGTTMRLFINGDERRTSAQSPLWSSDTNGLLIGANQNQDVIEEFFEGALDSLGLWKRALSVEEIKRLSSP